MRWTGRRLSAFHEPDDAYVLLVDAAGNVRWRTEGAATDAVYGQMKQQIAALRAGLD